MASLCSCRSCCKCCGWSIVGPVLVAILAVLVAELLPPTGQFGNTRTLAELPRVNASDIDPETFVERFVLRGVPVAIRIEDPDPAAINAVTGVPKGSLAEALLGAPCASNKLRLLSTQQEDVVAELMALPFWQRCVVDLLLIAATGSTVEGWVQRRLVSLSELAVTTAEEEPQPRFLVRLLAAGAKLLGTPFSLGIATLAQLVAQPVYLADKPVEDICPEVLEALAGKSAPGGGLSDYEIRAKARLKKLHTPKPKWRNLTELEPLGMMYDGSKRFFWGGLGSYVYPLHRDVSDGDVVCNLYSGCKEVVLLRPHSRHYLTRIDVPGFEYMRQFTWLENLFTQPPPDGVQGWSGTITAGEMIYFPGDMLHHIRNACRQTVTVCRRPWRASVARDVFVDSIKTLRLIHEHEDLEAMRRHRAWRNHH